ncbi:hypothetical protein EJD97_005866, partial [Solanum chilense]
HCIGAILASRRCRSPVGWFEVGESSTLGPGNIHEALEKVRVIRDRLATSYSQQKSYVDNIKWTFEFDVGDQVYLQISPLNGGDEVWQEREVESEKCLGDSSSILPVEGLGVDEDLCYEEVPIEILDRQVKWLKNKEISTLKVLWRNHLVEGAKWEAEADMRSLSPHLFSS